MLGVANYVPITDTTAGFVENLASSLIGTRIRSVLYRNLAGDPELASSGVADEVDMEIVVRLDNGASLTLAWAMSGEVEGLALLDGEPESDDRTVVDVTSHTQWSTRVGREVIAVGAGWHVPNAGSPRTLWSWRLSFEGGPCAVVATGELVNGEPRYLPDSLVVIFDERLALSYGADHSPGGAFGQTHTTAEGRGAR